MKLTLMGPRSGKTIKLADVHFKDGVADIPDDAGGLLNIMVNFHSAYPDSMLEDGPDGKQMVKAPAPEPPLMTIPHSNGTVAAAPAPEPVVEQVEGMDEAGTATQPSPNTKPAGRRKNG